MGESMIGVKDAVKNATEFVADLYPGARDIRLEEVEVDTEKQQEWSVVLSFKTHELGTLASVMGEQRLFKQVAVQLESGQPVSLRIWHCRV